MNFKFMENGLTTGSKIVLISFGSLFGLSLIATFLLGGIIGYFGLADTIPVWTTMTPLAGFVSLIVIAIIINISLIIGDMIVNKNYNEYIDLLKVVPSHAKTDDNFTSYIFDGNYSPNHE